MAGCHSLEDMLLLLAESGTERSWGTKRSCNKRCLKRENHRDMLSKLQVHVHTMKNTV